MDAAAIEDLFAPFGRVTVKRMFGGHGIYADGLIVGLQADGEIFLKTDDQTEPAFRGAGSRPFVYSGGAKTIALPYWLLPEAAYDDPGELVDWCRLALQASRRAAAAKIAKRAPKRIKQRRSSPS